MTHYWWMHWFWITTHLSLIHSTALSPTSTTTTVTVEPELTESQKVVDVDETTVPKVMSSTVAVADNDTEPEVNRTIYSDSEYSNNTNSNESVIVSGRGEASASASGWSSAAIAGVSVGAVLCATLVAASSLAVYRRRYLNKPHTLNDKCSNPDSSGYIDDSTIRENSEEMYSLDNDSFLNSLEAMTIQNYWTDTVKHTKL